MVFGGRRRDSPQSGATRDLRRGTTGAHVARIHNEKGRRRENMANPSYNTVAARPNEQLQWRILAYSPVDSLWNLHGSTVMEIARRTWKSLNEDRVFSRAAELGFYFFFSLFPAMFCAAAALGLVARSAHQFYYRLIGYLWVVVPHAALGIVLHTFNQTAAQAGSEKVTLSLLGAIWTASIGVSAIQDTLNDVYKIRNTRSFVGARIKAIGLTFLLAGLVTVSLASMFGGAFVASLAAGQIKASGVAEAASIGIRAAAWVLANLLLVLMFAVIHYWAPDWRRRRWRWLTPGSAIGIAGWLAASVALRTYLQYFNNYAITYGSLGAVIILLTWFYITGLMLLAGGEIDSEIEAAAVEKGLARHNGKHFHAGIAA